MRVIEAKDIDLIEPFPPSEIKRLVGWLHCYKTIMEVDGDPQTAEDKEVLYAQLLSAFPSWGVIDRNNTLAYKHEAPLIGFAYLQPGASPSNCYIHFASTRRAWGSGLIDQAALRLIPYIFETYPSLLRISGAILNTNKPAKAFAKRVGFKQDGLLKDFITQNAEPRSVAHFGFLRRDLWAAANPQPLPLEINSTNPVEQTQAASQIPS